MAIKWDSEKELAKVVVDDLRASGWTVYPELCDIDIVAVRADSTCRDGKRIIGIECKKQFNLTVLSQADSKRIYVDEMYVAVATGRNQEFGCKVARILGFGVLIVHKWRKLSGYEYSVMREVDAEFKPRKRYSLEKLLDPQAETFAEAGQAGGKQWTVFKKTAGVLVEYVTANPGKSMKEVVAAITHHYRTPSSAVGSLSKMVRKKVISQIHFVDDLLYPYQ